MSSVSGFRSALAVRTGLVAAMAASACMMGYSYVVQHQNVSEDTEPTTISAVAPTDPSSSTTSTLPGAPAPFSTADVGDCLTWDIDEAGKISNFDKTDCNSEHRFEVSARENLATYPASEFGPEAAMPDLTRQAQLREELCRTPTLRYLDGVFDPVGRYSIAPILPPPEAWAQGDRTMLCGIQSTDPHGTPMTTIGYAKDQDQARVMQPGQCAKVDEAGALRTVDCAEDHQLEATAIVNLAPVFPEGTPSVEQQDEHLRHACTQAAMDYLGGEEQLYHSTLQPYWTTQPRTGWEGGSRSVNCALVAANPDANGFATLTGTATAPFLINGAPPPPRPERNPLRPDQQPPPA